MDKMKPGKHIRVYEDPITETKFEGIARIVRIHKENNEYIRADVIFLDDGIDGMEVYRTIYKTEQY